MKVLSDVDATGMRVKADNGVFSNLNADQTGVIKFNAKTIDFGNAKVKGLKVEPTNGETFPQPTRGVNINIYGGTVTINS